MVPRARVFHPRAAAVLSSEKTSRGEQRDPSCRAGVDGNQLAGSEQWVGSQARTSFTVMDEGANSDAMSPDDIANAKFLDGNADFSMGMQHSQIHSHREISEEAASGPDLLCMLGDDLLLIIWPSSRITLGMRVNRWLNSVLRQAPQVIDHRPGGNPGAKR